MQATAIKKKIAAEMNDGLNKMERLAEPFERTALRVPSNVYIAAGLDCCVLATAFTLAKKHHIATMFGTWSMFSMLMGIYAKVSEKK